MLTFEYFFVVAIGFLSISSGVTLSVPYFIGTIIDTIYTLSDKALLMQNLQSVAAWLVGLFVVGAAANGARIYLIESSGTTPPLVFTVPNNVERFDEELWKYLPQFLLLYVKSDLFWGRGGWFMHKLFCMLFQNSCEATKIGNFLTSYVE